MPEIQHKRGTRSALTALAAANGLLPGQIYVLTDESRIAVATSVSAFETFAKESEAGGGGGGFVEIFNATPTAVAQIAITGLADYNEFIIECNGVRHSGATTARILVMGSTDAGSTYGANIGGLDGAAVSITGSVFETRSYLNWRGIGIIITGGSASNPNTNTQQIIFTQFRSNLFKEQIRLVWANNFNFVATGNIRVLARA
jgi:hypothetical protein